MSSGTLDDAYLFWLYSQVGNVNARKGSKTYWNLLRELYRTEFVWFVPNDDNRVADGCELRTEWAHKEDVFCDEEWLSLGCSFLEMLVGLARRMEFEAERTASFWFWHLIDNMGLLGFHDASKFSSDDVEELTSMVIWRTYDRLGHGGLFPLRESRHDQRRVEIWYQLSEYLQQTG